MVGGLSALAVALALCLVSAEARAQGVELEWQAPDGCPGRERVEAGVVRITGRTIRDSSGSFALLRATVSVEGGRYRMTLVALETNGAERERTVLASDCEQAAEAAIAVLATTLGASALEAPAAETQAVESPAPAAPPPPSAQPQVTPPRSAAGTAPPAPRRERPALEGSFGAALGVELGTLPRAAPFGLIRGGFALGRFMLHAEGAATLPVTTQISGTNSGAYISLLRGTLTGCYRVPWKPGLVAACAGGELGSLIADGFGVKNDEPGSALWSAGVLELLFRADVASWLALSAGAGLVVPFQSVEVVVRPLPALYETLPIVGRFWLGAEFVAR